MRTIGLILALIVGLTAVSEVSAQINMPPPPPKKGKVNQLDRIEKKVNMVLRMLKKMHGKHRKRLPGGDDKPREIVSRVDPDCVDRLLVSFPTFEQILNVVDSCRNIPLDELGGSCSTVNRVDNEDCYNEARLSFPTGDQNLEINEACKTYAIRC